MRVVALFTLLLTLAACATKAPTQEMAEARSAIETAQKLPNSSQTAESHLDRAESALDEAVEAIKAEQYDRARRLALEAKRRAQMAAEQKQRER